MKTLSSNLLDSVISSALMVTGHDHSLFTNANVMQVFLKGKKSLSEAGD